MKRKIMGVVCGAVILSGTGVWASSSIEAILFPSSLTIQHYEESQQVDGSQSALLNYNNSVYIPLRTFAETMGSIVQYTPPASPDDLPHIQVLPPNINISESKLIYSDEERQVSAGYLSRTSPDVFHGLIKFYTDLKDKSIVLEAFNKEGERVAQSQYVRVHGQESASFAAGDLRSFEASMSSGRFEEADTFQVKVIDRLQPMNGQFIDLRYGDPIGILFGPPFGFRLATQNPDAEDHRAFIEGPYGPIYGLFAGYVQRGHTLPLSVQIYNTSTSDLIFDPIHVQLAVKRVNADQSETDVYIDKLPIFSGLWKSKVGYRIDMPWNVTDQEGKPLPEGTYHITLEVPETVTYRIDGSDEVLTYHPFVRFNDFYANLE